MEGEFALQGTSLHHRVQACTTKYELVLKKWICMTQYEFLVYKVPTCTTKHEFVSRLLENVAKRIRAKFKYLVPCSHFVLWDN